MLIVGKNLGLVNEIRLHCHAKAGADCITLNCSLKQNNSAHEAPNSSVIGLGLVAARAAALIRALGTLAFFQKWKMALYGRGKTCGSGLKYYSGRRPQPKPVNEHSS
jgi:hypothetical protein